MEERVQISLLLDLYSELLTDKQREIMLLYFNDDLSLSEISEINSTSRQAIYDIIKRCQKLLLKYDNKLGLMKKHKEFQTQKQIIMEKLDAIKKLTEENNIHNIVNDIKKDVLNM